MREHLTEEDQTVKNTRTRWWEVRQKSETRLVLHSFICTADFRSWTSQLQKQTWQMANCIFCYAVSLVSEVQCCLEVYASQVVDVRCSWLLLAATAISLHPVRLRLHLHQSGDGPLERKDLLLSCEQSQVLCCVLKRGQPSARSASDTLKIQFKCKYIWVGGWRDRFHCVCHMSFVNMEVLLLSVQLMTKLKQQFQKAEIQKRLTSKLDVKLWTSIKSCAAADPCQLDSILRTRFSEILSSLTNEQSTDLFLIPNVT